MSRENLANFVRFWGRSFPESVAIVDGDVVTTWAELDRRTNRLANGLRELGISKGDRIGLLAPNCQEYIDAVIAGNKIGAIIVPLIIRLTASELRFIVLNSGCRMVIAHPSLADVATRALEDSDAGGDGGGRRDSGDVVRVGLEPGFGLVLSEIYSDDVTDRDTPVNSEEVAFICYTSGTTGLPKGAMLSHANVIANANFRSLADHYNQSARLYLPAPLAFTGTLMTWAFAYVGGGSIMLDTVVDPRRSLEVIQNHRITHFAAVPVIWERMLRDPDFASYDLSSLQTCVTGGATVTKAFLQSLWDVGLPVRNGYGLTEGSGYCTWQSLNDSQREPSSVGRSGIHNRVRIVDHTAVELIDVQVGEVGEIIESGPEVMLGYWNDADATASTLVDGWLRTGDLGRLTEDGDLHIVGRIKDMFISGGLNVYPAEIESVLGKIDGVVECAVIGVSDDRWGETAAAIICTLADVVLEPNAIRDYCRTHLADYKLPRYVVLRDVPLPRNMSGKVLKRNLLEEYSNPSTLGPPLH
jgi:fatty-acyl-CoA synthase